MPLFTSERERRLWLVALAVVAAIYSTLGLATELAAKLRNRGLIDTAFFWAFVVIVAAVVIVPIPLPRGRGGRAQRGWGGGDG